MELLERDKPLNELSAWLQSAKGSGCIVLIAGEAGIGKTSLLQRFTSQQKVLRNLWGACDALFTPRPLAPLHDIARQTRGALPELLDRRTGRDAIFSATLDELERTPSVVVFEDMHWADEATLDLVKFLGRRIQRTRSMLLLSYRDDEVGPRHPLRFVVGDLPRAATHRLPLTALSAPAVERLALAAGRSVAGLHALTGGNPLFVTELLAAGADAVPTTVSDAVLARASRLSTHARELAELVCVIPTRADAWLIEKLAVDESIIESCLSMGMVRHADGALAFRHELTRRAMQDALSQTRQQASHARVLALLMQRADISAARLAHHADGARDTAAVQKFAPLAAREAVAVGAHREAVAYFALALRYADSLGAEARAQLLEPLSYESYLTDQIERSIEARSAALAIWRESGNRLKEGDTLRWLSRLSWFAGRRADAEHYGDEAVGVLQALSAGPELAMAYSNRAQLDMLATRSAPAIEWAQRAIALAEAQQNDDILSHALNNLGAARIAAGEERGWEDLERSLRIALERGFQEHAARAYTNLGANGIATRDYARGFRWLNEGIAYCERHDLDSWFAYMRAWRARGSFEQCDWPAAAEDAESVARGPRTAPISRIPALIVLGHLRLRRGDPDAQSQFEQVRKLIAPMGELQRLAPLAVALAEAAWFAEDPDAVVREVRPAYELACTLPDIWSKGELAAWLWRVQALDCLPNDIAKPYALELAGNWRGAAELWMQYGCPYDHACMLAWYGDEEDKREALLIFERLGASPAAQLLRKQLRAQGVRGVPRGARPSTRANEYGLTRRESQILELLAQGLRNAVIAKRLFLSTKTVDHHVSAILSKLGVPSRAEAVAMARSTADEK
jgi:DNA-binding CsgD family transcriptional regulator